MINAVDLNYKKYFWGLRCKNVLPLFLHRASEVFDSNNEETAIIISVYSINLPFLQLFCRDISYWTLTVLLLLNLYLTWREARCCFVKHLALIDFVWQSDTTFSSVKFHRSFDWPSIIVEWRVDYLQFCIFCFYALIHAEKFNLRYWTRHHQFRLWGLHLDLFSIEKSSFRF